MKREQPPPPSSTRWPILIAAAGFFLAEVAVVAGAASPFRLPKDAVALAALCLAVGLAVLSAARRKTLDLPRGRLVLVVLALPALQAFSAMWGANPLRSLESAALSGIWVIGTLWLATLDDKGRRTIVFAAAIGVGLSVLVVLVQLAGVSVFNFAAPFASKRLSLTGLTGNPADLAMASVLLLPFLLTWGESSSRPRIFRSLAVLLALGTLITQTLTGIVALGAVVLVWLVQQRSRKLWVTVAAVGTILVAAALAAGLGDRLQKEAGRVRAGNWYRLLSARGDGWTAAEEMIREHPIAGVGAANYTQMYYPSRLAWLTRNGGTGGRSELASHFQWAHCDPMQVVAELGIPGLMWMVFLAWAIITSGKRASPLLPLMIAAVTPFLLLHYPTHLAISLVPICLALAHVIAHAQPVTALRWNRARVPVAFVVVVLAGAGAFWQLRRVAVDLWMGGHEIRMAIVQRTDPENRARFGKTTESQILPRLGRLKIHGPALWRTVGRARMLQGDAKGAEAAFRTSYDGWPHEDAEFYLGVSLHAQGRRNEALSHLSRVCRTNPKLIDLINDKKLRRTLLDVVETYRTR